MTSRPRILALALAAALSFVAACEEDEPTAEPPPADPFSLEWRHGEGTSVELAGDRTGHEAGGTSDFQLTLRNPTGEAWTGEYCILLLSEAAGEVVVQHDTFDVESGADLGMTFPVTFPDELQDAVVGFAVIVPERGAAAGRIEVGRPAAGAPAPPTTPPECPGE